MSYDIRLGVKVVGAEDLYAVIAEPEYSSPTYNIGTMLRKCMDWDFDQGEWYKVSDVLKNIRRGIEQLTLYEKRYTKYNSPNGWGTTESARTALKSLYECIRNNSEEASCTWNAIPLELMYVRW